MWIRIPYKKILFLPYISANLPNGTRNIAEDNRYDVATQLNKIASISNSILIDGRATFTADPMKDVRKDAIEAMSNTNLLSSFLSKQVQLMKQHRIMSFFESDLLFYSHTG